MIELFGVSILLELMWLQSSKECSQPQGVERCCCVHRTLDIASFHAYRPVESTGLGSTESGGEPVSAVQ